MMMRLALLAAAAVAAVQATDDDGVLALTPETFDEFVGKDKPAFVEFYAPWCGHCKNLAPEWAKLASTFKLSDGVVIAKVDADGHRELGSRFEVRGFPTIKWFPAGSYEPEDYNGGRTVEDLVEFVNSKTGLRKKVKAEPSSVLALTPETFDAVANDPIKHKLIEFYAPWCGHCKNLAPTWEKLGAAFEGESNVVVAKVDADKHRELGERFGVTGFPTLKYVPPTTGGARAEDAAVPYEGGRDMASLVAFLNEKAGTQRSPSGGLLPTAGRVAAFDERARAFMAAPAGERAALLAASQAASKGVTGAGPYVKAMEAVLKKGDGYAAKEIARIEGMLASDAVGKAKKTELALKKNVLASFAPADAKEEL